MKWLAPGRCPASSPLGLLFRTQSQASVMLIWGISFLLQCLYAPFLDFFVVMCTLPKSMQLLPTFPPPHATSVKACCTMCVHKRGQSFQKGSQCQALNHIIFIHQQRTNAFLNYEIQLRGAFQSMQSCSQTSDRILKSS